MPDAQAALAETHISVLVSVGERVYKLKKPVTLPFLDFSTREARRAACHREVELNRRLAPDVYLGVADVAGPDGQPCDHLVVMRRMPAARRLAALVRAGDEVDRELGEIARQVAAFHAGAPTSPEIAAAATRDAVRDLWAAGFEQVAPFVGDVIPEASAARLEDLVFRYLDGRELLFAQRIEAGRICDGHGDLQAEDIFCLADGPRILDCVEFDDRLRFGDGLADVAFLAMDLERLGARAAADLFLDSYREYSGDTYPASLASHYIAYRAHIRAKVACLRHEQGDPEAAATARGLMALALRRLEAGRVTLVLVGGLPGTGKSTLAAGIGRRRDWAVIRSDEVRRAMAFGAGPPGGAGPPAGPGGPPASFAEGRYRPEMTEEVYRTLLERARHALELGESVVLDASWISHRLREAAAKTAEAAAAELVEFRCDAPADIAAARIHVRQARGGSVSEATSEVAEAMARLADPWAGAIRIDTAGTPAAALRAAMAVLGAEGEG